MARAKTVPIPLPLKAELAMRRMTLRQLAELVDRTPYYIGRIANGFAWPSQELRTEIARVMGLPEIALFGDADAVKEAM